MFSYCNNNPVNLADYSGEDPISVACTALVSLGVLAVTYLAALLIPEEVKINAANSFHDAVDSIASITASVTSEVYEFSREIRESLKNFSRKMPQVHHIVPAGSFSSRSAATQSMISDMHQKLSNAGINRYTDPINLMLVSAGTHATLHTDAYIAHVHSYIMAAEGKAGIYAAMHYLRLEIAAWDTLAGGY